MKGLVFNNFLTQSRKPKLLLVDKYQKEETRYAGEALATHVVYATADEEYEEWGKVRGRNKNKGQEKAR